MYFQGCGGGGGKWAEEASLVGRWGGEFDVADPSDGGRRRQRRRRLEAVVPWESLMCSLWERRLRVVNELSLR
ncbi:hypothetical protein TIFTF001_050250 [Ficus carica]|uniref:Uncharacterized protein n=1 Tax=Ficus carica TaxID=3494 RepID=A0AA87Z7H1_FICCA|nr:hypothetical protein TIFTF001_050250 [Ficus carica]